MMVCLYAQLHQPRKYSRAMQVRCVLDVITPKHCCKTVCANDWAPVLRIYRPEPKCLYLHLRFHSRSLLDQRLSCQNTTSVATYRLSPALQAAGHEPLLCAFTHNHKCHKVIMQLGVKSWSSASNAPAGQLMSHAGFLKRGRNSFTRAAVSPAGPVTSGVTSLSGVTSNCFWQDHCGYP